MSEQFPDPMYSPENIKRVSDMLYKFCQQYILHEVDGKAYLLLETGITEAGIYQTEDPSEVDTELFWASVIDPDAN